MNIVLNGEARHIQAALTIAGLLQSEGLAERRVAVEVNGEIVPRSAHAGHDKSEQYGQQAADSEYCTIASHDALPNILSNATIRQ